MWLFVEWVAGLVEFVGDLHAMCGRSFQVVVVVWWQGATTAGWREMWFDFYSAYTMTPPSERIHH